jgi:hypothetical protein
VMVSELHKLRTSCVQMQTEIIEAHENVGMVVMFFRVIYFETLWLGREGGEGGKG